MKTKENKLSRQEATIVGIFTVVVVGVVCCFASYASYQSTLNKINNPALPTIAQQTAPVNASPGFSHLYTFNGHGEGTTDLFSMDKGIARIKWKNDADYSEAYFSVWIKRLDAEGSDLLVSEFGDTSGQHIMNVDASDQYIFDVASDGNWTITVEFK